MNLLESLVESLEDSRIDTIARSPEEDRENVISDIPLVFATIVGGSLKKLSVPEGNSILDDLISTVETSDTDSDDNHRHEGKRVLRSLLNGGADDLMGAISNYCKVPRHKLGKLFHELAWDFASNLRAAKTRLRLDGEAMRALLFMQRPDVEKALPDNLFAALGLRHLGPDADRLVETNKDAIEKAVRKAESRTTEKSLMGKLIPVGILTLVFIVIWTFVKGCVG